MKDIISVSVRSLVEFIGRSGDIDNRRRAVPEDAMLEGSRIHRLLQRQGGPGYRAEVALNYTVEGENYDLRIDGRADGIITLDDRVTVDEIKGVYRDLKYLDAPVEVHLSQAKCYAYIYAADQGLKEISVRMTYCNLDTEELKYFHFGFTFGELSYWFRELIRAYRKWADYFFEWRKVRDASIESLPFPFPYRKGQKELSEGVYRTIFHGRRLFLEAPTGVGKTLAVLYPSIKSIYKNLTEKLFYLTAKNLTASVAEDAFLLLRKGGLSFKTVTIQAREKLCLLAEPSCNPQDCPYAKGHFDRINDAIFDLLQTGDEYGRETLRSYGEERRVCPFEMALDLSYFADGIIMDYNYLFDPHVKLQRFFGDGVKGQYLFLIDEAHNLVDRAREMYSAFLFKEDFLLVRRKILKDFPKCASSLSSCNTELLKLKKSGGDFSIDPDISAFLTVLRRAAANYGDMLEELGKEGKQAGDEVLRLYFAIRDFLNIAEDEDSNYVNYSELQEDGSFLLKLYCVNPSRNLRKYLDKGRSAVFFSATLLPVNYYMDLLSGDRTDYTMYAASVFRPENRGVFIGTDVSSRYQRRTDSEYERIAGYILSAIEGRRGNYMVFFPSYAFLKQVHERFAFLALDRDIDCVLQDPYMGEERRRSFLSLFQEGDLSQVEVGDEELKAQIHMEIEVEKRRTLIGFCVMGGIFGEGIDLKGESLVGAIIVGTGLPQVCHERQILKEAFDGQDLDGFNYAYLYPGLNRVLQAAGRVIRTEKDRGFVLLLDDRFLGRAYRRLFPREWNNIERVERRNVGDRIREFWKQGEAGSTEILGEEESGSIEIREEED
ncbi:MAG: ATP-dependent DNA helicase [Lachnospiraceae bacterium]|nr:ATP-dependent DNA helicase [Lachnospiraceae bacterium]